MFCHYPPDYLKFSACFKAYYRVLYNKFYLHSDNQTRNLLSPTYFLMSLIFCGQLHYEEREQSFFTKHLRGKHCHTQGHGRFACTFPPPCSRSYVIFAKQTHSLQITDPPHTHIRRPRLEQHFDYQLPSSSNSSVEMSSGYRQLSQAHSHSPPALHS